jgi:channel protein (hemolysin III family)
MAIGSSFSGLRLRSSMALLYGRCSTLYQCHHKYARVKKILQLLDHAIYLLIAGTYTLLLTLVPVARGDGYYLVWSGAMALGAVSHLKHFGALPPAPVNRAVDLVYWRVVIAIADVATFPKAGFVLGWCVRLPYTAGVAFATDSRLRYGHFVWQSALAPLATALSWYHYA